MKFLPWKKCRNPQQNRSKMPKSCQSLTILRYLCSIFSIFAFCFEYEPSLSLTLELSATKYTALEKPFQFLNVFSKFVTLLGVCYENPEVKDDQEIGYLAYFL